MRTNKEKTLSYTPSNTQYLILKVFACYRLSGNQSRSKQTEYKSALLHLKIWPCVISWPQWWGWTNMCRNIYKQSKQQINKPTQFPKTLDRVKYKVVRNWRQARNIQVYQIHPECYHPLELFINGFCKETIIVSIRCFIWCHMTVQKTILLLFEQERHVSNPAREQ